MRTTTSMELAEAIGRKHSDTLKLLRLRSKSLGRKFRTAKRTVRHINGLTRETPYFLLTAEDLRLIRGKLTKPEARRGVQKLMESMRSGGRRTPAPKAEVRQPNIRVFTSDKFGELHYSESGGELWFCMPDIYRSLNMMVLTGERIARDSEAHTSLLYVLRKKRTSSEKFTDRDGLLSLVIGSGHPKADEYRKWVDREVSGISGPRVKVMDYPTIDEYFREYVSVDEFNTALSEVNRYCNKSAPVSVRRNVEILETFSDTLTANYKPSPLKCK